jgi:autotransporter-associated beta strand protein
MNLNGGIPAKNLRPANARLIKLLAHIFLPVFLLLPILNVQATSFFWDANGAISGAGSSGVWDASSSLWRNGSLVGALGNWPNTGVNTDAAVFTNAPGLVSLNSSSININVNSVIFTNGSSGYLIAPPGSGSATLNFSGLAPTIIHGTNNVAISAVISGSSGLTRVGTTGALTLSGSNTFSGGTTNAVTTGVLILQHPNALGTGALTMQATTTSSSSTLRLAGGISVTNATIIDSTSGREGIDGTNGNNTLGGGITITGAGANTIIIQNGDATGAGTTFTISNTITAATYTNLISLRGNAGNFGLIAGTVNAPSMTLQVNGSADWTISSTGNNWATTQFLGGSGKLLLGTNNALAINAKVNWGTAIGNSLDLAGYNQTIGGLDVATTTSTPTVTNSSAASDSVLTINGGGYTFAGAIKDGVTKKISVTLASGTQTFAGANTYSGATIISGGTLALGAGGSINNSTNIFIAAGATFDISAINAFNLSSSAVLNASGIGGTNAVISGASGGTINLGSRPVTLNFTPTSFNGDTAHPALAILQGSLTLSGQITVNNNGASPLSAGTYTLISQASGNISGTPTLNPLIGGQGLVTNSSASIAVNGNRIDLVISVSSPAFRISSLGLTGGNLVVGGIGGTAGYAYKILSSTNVALPFTNWTALATNLFNADGSFNFTNAINPGEPKRFYIVASFNPGNGAMVVAVGMNQSGVPWYSTAWHAWNQGGHNPANTNSVGRRDLDSIYYPAIGLYDDADPEYIEYACQIMAMAEIDSICIRHHDYTDAWANHAHSNWFPILKSYGLTAFPRGGGDQGTNGVGIVYNMFQPAMTTISNRGVYAFFSIDSSLSNAAILAWKNSYPATNRPFVLQWVNKGLGTALDGGYDWIGNRTSTNYFKNTNGFVWWFNVAQAAEGYEDDLVQAQGFIADGSLKWFGEGMNPGFDDSAVNGWGAGKHYIERGGGQTYIYRWQRACQNGYPAAFIPTFDDWGEGSTIFPTVEYGNQYMELTRQYASIYKSIPTNNGDFNLPKWIYQIRKNTDNVSTLTAMSNACGWMKQKNYPAAQTLVMPYVSSLQISNLPTYWQWTATHRVY